MPDATNPPAAPSTSGPDVRDLAEQVHNYLAEKVTDSALSGFTVHRRHTDGTAAVTYRPGIVPAYTAVLRWTLTTWAALLRDAGFVIEIEACDDRRETDVPQWLRITGRDAVAPVGVTTEQRFSDLLDTVGGSAVRETQEFPTSAVDPSPCTCRSCEKWRVASVLSDRGEPANA